MNKTIAYVVYGLIMKPTAEQQGILLKELLSFLLARNGKAKRDDVYEHLLDQFLNSNPEQDEEKYHKQIEFIASMCVKAGWLERSGYWKVTDFGGKAYQRYSSPKVLFQEMAVQSVIRNENSAAVKIGKHKLAGLVVLGLVASPCTLIGFVVPSPHLLYLAFLSLALLVISLVLFNSRTKRIIAGRVLMMEFLILCFTLVLDVIFATTSWNEYFQLYFFAILVLQGISITGVFLAPHFFSKVFQFINQSKWLIIVSMLLLVLLFGGKVGHGGGLIENIFGKDFSVFSFTIVYAGLMSLGMIFIVGGIVFNLEQVGYYE